MKLRADGTILTRCAILLADEWEYGSYSPGGVLGVFGGTC